MQEVTSVLFSIKGFDITLSDVASVATAISVIIGIFQLASGKKVRQETARRAAVKEAVDIAKVFQREVLDDISFTLSIYRINGLESYLESKIPNDLPLRFTREEAKEFCGEDCEELYNKYENKIDQKVLDAAAYTNVKYKIEKKIIPVDCKNESKEKVDAQLIYRNKIIEFHRARVDALNKLEWIAMMINSNAADGNVIYQSLHQTICSFIRDNYLYIAHQNTDTNACDQYYTNLMDLYNGWVVASCKKQKENAKRLKKQAKRNAKLQKRNIQERSRSIIRTPKM